MTSAMRMPERRNGFQQPFATAAAQPAATRGTQPIGTGAEFPAPPKKPPRPRHRQPSGFTNADALRDFWFRLGTGVIALTTALLLAAFVGLLNSWTFSAGLVLAEGLAVAIVFMLGEYLRALVFHGWYLPLRRAVEERSELAIDKVALPIELEGASALGGSTNAFTQTFNRTIAVVCLVLSAPVLLLIASMIRLSSRGKALERTTYIGKDRRRHETIAIWERRGEDLGGTVFTAYRFRTTYKDASGHAIGADGEEMTTVGRFLQTTGLGHLPMLWSILRGDLSLIGPRPLRPSEVEKYHRAPVAFAVRGRVQPGLISSAMAMGVTSIGTGDELLADLEYLRRVAVFGRLRTDLAILVRAAMRWLGRVAKTEISSV